MSEKLFRAGLIPYYVEDGVVKMLFMMPSDPMYGGSEFQLCKGKVEHGETDMEAALREASEEVGLLSQNVVRIADLGNFLGRTTVFVAKVKDPTMFGPFSFETMDIRWMTAEQFENEGRMIHKHVIAAAYDKIVELERLS